MQPNKWFIGRDIVYAFQHHHHISVPNTVHFRIGRLGRFISAATLLPMDGRSTKLTFFLNKFNGFVLFSCNNSTLIVNG